MEDGMLIPSNAKKITKGKRIFEFTDTRMHKLIDTNNKLVYRLYRVINLGKNIQKVYACHVVLKCLRER